MIYHWPGAIQLAHGPQGERFGLGTSLPLVGQSNASAKEAKESLWLAYNQTGDYGQLEESTRCHG